MLLIDGLNNECKNTVFSYKKVDNDPMSYIFLWTTPKGDSYHLYKIFRKMEALGVEFKTLVWYIT